MNSRSDGWLRSSTNKKGKHLPVQPVAKVKTQKRMSVSLSSQGLEGVLLLQTDHHQNASSCFPSGSAVKNLPAMQEPKMWIRPLGQEDPLEEGVTAHSRILAWRIPWTERLTGYSLWGHKELGTT